MGAQFSRKLSSYLRFFNYLGMSKKLVCVPCSRFPIFLHFFEHLGIPPAVFWQPLGSSGVSWAFSCRPFGCLWLAWAVFGLAVMLFCDTGPQGGGSQLSFVFCYVFFLICMCFSKCFLTRESGRGRAVGAAEDHTSIQHSLGTIALKPFFAWCLVLKKNPHPTPPNGGPSSKFYIYILFFLFVFQAHIKRWRDC